jgi:ferric-dicitrate binding protein FerR (iron transport regulator)
MNPYEADKPLADDLLDRYLAGQASAEETAIVHAYFTTSPVEVARVFKQASVIYPDPSEPSPSDTDVLWQRVVARIANKVEGPSSQQSLTTQRRRTPWFKVPTTAVAALGFLIIVAVAWLHSFDIIGELGQSRPGTLATHIITTRPGQQEKVHLPDGSVAILAPSSTLEYAADFGQTVRNITLTGEALFTVTNNDGAPFIVQTAHAAVRVLGTTFVVRRYADEPSTRVVVAQGKVSVATKVLTNGDAAVLDATGRIQTSHSVDIASALAWTTGTIVFQRTPLREVIPELERWYGVKFVVQDSVLLDEPLTMTFLTTAPEDAFKNLARLLHAGVTQKEDHVIIERIQGPGH